MSQMPNHAQPTRCPRCRRPLAFYVDRIGYVTAYCWEQERREQQGLGECAPIAPDPVTSIAPPGQQELLPPRTKYTKGVPCPQRAPKNPRPPQWTHEQRMEHCRRYWLRKYGKVA
jgi:hypothetical protein